jgi:glycosyltransferase involved in cell wall biosynthesis
MRASGVLRLKVLIPVFNEADALPLVLADLPREFDGARVDEVVIVDNGSTDGSDRVARDLGATVLHEGKKGYGSACLRGLAHLAEAPPEVVVFLDGDHSDHPEELSRHVEALRDGAELVIGSRTLGNAAPGALLPQARFGNWLATRLIRLFYGVRFTDLGPFRAVTWDALEAIGMRDDGFGWTCEMQVKAARLGLDAREVPVSYRKRVGVSKITGTVQGTVRAGIKIIWTIFRHVGPMRPRRQGS